MFGNKQAPSRDIATGFTRLERLRFVCGGGTYDGQKRLAAAIRLHDIVFNLQSSMIQVYMHSDCFFAGLERSSSDCSIQLLFKTSLMGPQTKTF